MQARLFATLSALICLGTLALPAAPPAAKHQRGTEAPAYTDAMFRQALANESTAPLYLLATIRDANTGAVQHVCVEAPSLESAVYLELSLTPSAINKLTVLRWLLDNPAHLYTFSKPAILARVAARYTPAVLQEVRQRLAAYTPAQLRDPKVFNSIHSDSPHGDDGAYRDATAQVLLEHGILCGQNDLTGSLYLAP